MLEKAIRRITTISDRYPTVEIYMKVLAMFPSQQDHSVGIKMLPSLIPENLTDVLFFEGACEGIHDAIYENDQALHLSTIEVEIDELNVSVPLTSFNSSEIAKIGIELRSMAKEAFRSILSDSI